MNKIRRKKLQEIIDRANSILCDLEELKEEEEAYRDTIPENLHNSERYEKAETACDSLYEAISYLEEATQNIEIAIEC